MKYFLHFAVVVLLVPLIAEAQITTPIIKAAFGVDADLRANYFNGFIQSGNDDWFNNGTAGTGNFILDTTGAAALIAGYLSDVSPWPKRSASFFRTMNRPQFSVVNNRLWLDALFVRDYHGNDTTVFASGSSKNGMSPFDWSCPVSQSIPDKNDILDMFLHIRRAGPTITDSLWMFGALSLDNVTGNRYFDFEMYQTDIYYDRVSRQWYGYGPDMGHTSWQFDAAGNVTRPGDVIFTAVYQSSALTNIEARIWVNQNSLSIIPAQFNWSGQYDGANMGSAYGYASILPKTAGAFYTGLGCGNNTWAGVFQVVLQNNALAVNYVKDQFMEFSVNLTKLGLDPVTTFGSDICGTPFNRLVVKTRASSSFTAELKDFVAPTDLFLAPRAIAAAEAPILCTSITTSIVSVINPHPTSVYTWTTPNGHIAGPATGDSILVDSAGTYIVSQRLLAGCSVYATDTVLVTRIADCMLLPGNFRLVSASLNKSETITDIYWTVVNNGLVKNFVVEKSKDGIRFEEAGVVFANSENASEVAYHFKDDIFGTLTKFIYYRIRLLNFDGNIKISRVLKVLISLLEKDELTIIPNPVHDRFQIKLFSTVADLAEVIIFDMQGRVVMKWKTQINKGENKLIVSKNENCPPSTYMTVVKVGQKVYYNRVIIIE